MIFEYDGREFDTNNRIYVLGYKITTHWFPFNSNNHSGKGDVDYYGITIASAFIKELLFDMKEVGGNKKNVVVGFRLSFSKASGYSGNTTFGNSYVIGRSSKECMKIYQEKTKQQSGDTKQ